LNSVIKVQVALISGKRRRRMEDIEEDRDDDDDDIHNPYEDERVFDRYVMCDSLVSSYQSYNIFMQIFCHIYTVYSTSNLRSSMMTVLSRTFH
jgi:hypothetical protein